ncbi:MAG: DsbA family protein [Actinomycetota bacterium]|nr:DsbA family protein [Actinomycetota bacterium]
MAGKVSAKQVTQHRLVAEAAERAARERRTRITRVVTAVTVLALAVGGGVWWQVQRSAIDEVADPGPSVSSELLADGIALGGANSRPVVDVYLDFLCPHCADLEERIGDTIADLAASGDARVVIHPITLIDPAESARSAAAFGCAAGSDGVLGYQRGLFDNAGGGFSTERLVAIGASVGLTDAAFVRCVQDGTQAGWAAAVDAAAGERGVEGTPTILVDGAELDLAATVTPAAFMAELEALTG